LHKGAEANLYLDGGELVKERVEKKYRLPFLDARLRKSRTRREAKNLKKAEDAGVPVPKVIRCDERSYTLRMEYLEGDLVKDLFFAGEKVGQTSKEIGRILRLLHDAGYVHNDLTTSNLIKNGDTVYMIDFGLAYYTKRLEDRAMDLVVFKKSIEATHSKIAGKVWEGLLAGYAPDKEILKRIATIEGRVRYK